MITIKDINRAINHHTFTVRKARIIAFIVRNGDIIATGINTRKMINNKKDKYPFTIHAEFMAIRKAKNKVNDSDMYVIRLMKKGGFGTALPCKNCWNEINKSGIKRVFHT
jgi:deoxycytidylate deaminase